MIARVLTAGFFLGIMGLAILYAADPALDPSWSAITDCPVEPGCHAIVLSDETTLSNLKVPATIHRRRVVKIFTSRGAQEHADFVIPDPSGRETVKNLTARTVLPDGAIIPISSGHVTTTMTRKQSRRRARVTTIRFPGVVPGALLEASWLMSDSRAAIYVWYPWEIQEEIPILKATMTLKAGDTRLGWLQKGIYRPLVDFTDPKEESQRFTVRNIPSLPVEEMSPSHEVLRASLLFFQQDSPGLWIGRLAEDFARRLGGLLADKGAVPEKARGLAAGQETSDGRLRAIYRFVQTEIAGEEGRASPIAGAAAAAEAKSVGEVLARGYGDAFEKTILFVAMAREVGVDASLVVIAGRDRGEVRQSAPDLGLFDSFAVAVKSGADWAWYDPGSERIPFGMVSAPSEAVHPNALIITPRAPRSRGGKLPASERSLSARPQISLLTIPVSPPSRNVLTREATVSFGEDLIGTIEATDSGSGHVGVEHYLRYAKIAPDERTRALQAHLRAGMPAVELLSTTFTDVDTIEAPLTIRFTGRAPSLANAAPGRILLTGSVFDYGRPNPFAAAKRTTAAEFPFASIDSQRIVFQLPPGYTVAALPPPVILQEGALRFSASWSTEESGLIYQRRLEVGVVSWPAEDYAQLHSFFVRVHNADNNVAVLRKEGS